MKRVGKDGELDAALLFMASEASSFMTGATMVIDGGVSSTLGGTDYTSDMFAAMVEAASTARPSATLPEAIGPSQSFGVAGNLGRG